MDALENELMQHSVKIKADDLKAFESVTKLHDEFQTELSEISSNLGLLEPRKLEPRSKSIMTKYGKYHKKTL